MTGTNYFETFGISPSFFPDLKKLKQLFYAKSREFHPDFFSNASEDEKSDALLQSSLINKAYKIILDPELRFKHILQIEGLLKDDAKDEIQQSFLMEMMDLNEEIMELQIEFSIHKFDSLQTKLNQIRSEKRASYEPIMRKYPDVDEGQITKLKDFYLENKYLTRLEENIVALGRENEMSS